jgi:hypothetical protein
MRMRFGFPEASMSSSNHAALGKVVCPTDSRIQPEFIFDAGTLRY